jgi:hypothetical protein
VLAEGVRYFTYTSFNARRAGTAKKQSKKERHEWKEM